MEIEKKHIKIELTEAMLGTVPKNKDVYSKHIATKVRALAKHREENEEDLLSDIIEEEVETVEDIEEKGWTGFHRDEQGIFIYNYMIKGFAKAATDVAIEVGWIKPKIVNYKKWLDLLLFIETRKLRFMDGNGTIIAVPDGTLERPIRMMTPRGPRVTVTRSDTVDGGRLLEFDITLLPNSKGVCWNNLRHSFNYGERVGLGQWRGSGGYGSFKVVSIEDVMDRKDTPIIE
uniref:Uncharacterized protein n=1 Tax=viral metagenome TaxID=1070528 RepID=A0A6M3KXZ6_9ZZZZ